MLNPASVQENETHKFFWDFDIQMDHLIHWELYKKLKFDHTTKWYMHKLEPVLENDTPSQGLWNTNRSPNPSQKIRPSDN